MYLKCQPDQLGKVCLGLLQGICLLKSSFFLTTVTKSLLNGDMLSLCTKKTNKQKKTCKFFSVNWHHVNKMYLTWCDCKRIENF